MASIDAAGLNHGSRHGGAQAKVLTTAKPFPHKSVAALVRILPPIARPETSAASMDATFSPVPA